VSPASIAEVIRTEGGRVTFARFMELALTHPALGYYSRVERLLRHGGDFSTAPALSPFFNRTVARLVTELVDASLAAQAAAAAAARAASGPRAAESPPGRPCVVELGGGEGHLAESILRFWESERPELRERIDYRIVEVGARLRLRQAAAVDRFAAAGWDVGWGGDLEEVCIGARPAVIVGNEFLDALPVHLVDDAGATIREAYFTADDADLVGAWGDLSEAAAGEIGLLFGTLDPRRLEVLTEDGILEVCPRLNDLMRRVAGAMPSGSFVSVDYGEWFPGLPPTGDPWGLEGRARRRRSVRGYFKHQLVPDPLTRAGSQDLTADVDFAALGLHGRKEGFETVLFTTLARFLCGGGAEDELEALRNGAAQTAGDTLEADRQATVLQNLLDERDLGGAFKVMVQARG
jgi:SAM-dependent MidA family methyltransferase